MSQKSIREELLEEFVPYQESLELKELGFDKPCFGRYHGIGGNKGKIWYEMPNSGQQTIPVGDILAPTYRQAFRWFRKTYKLHSKIEIQDVELDWYFYEILEVKSGEYNNDLHEDINLKSYEEAELSCLRKLIEIVKK